MENINETDKNKLLQFITENDLDYDAVDNGIFKFNLNAYDGMNFKFFTFENKYVILKYDKKKDIPGQLPNEYFTFENMQQVLEQLKLYDNSLVKVWWQPIVNTIDLGIDMNTYNEEWFSDFINDDYIIENENDYSVIKYENETYKPELYSPFNTLHEVSLFNKETPNKLEKLSFEIHPISCMKNNESYLFKLAFNDEPILKEWINYRIFKKKGLRLFLETLFNEMEKYKI